MSTLGWIKNVVTNFLLQRVSTVFHSIFEQKSSNAHFLLLNVQGNRVNYDIRVFLCCFFVSNCPLATHLWTAYLWNKQIYIAFRQFSRHIFSIAFHRSQKKGNTGSNSLQTRGVGSTISHSTINTVWKYEMPCMCPKLRDFGRWIILSNSKNIHSQLSKVIPDCTSHTFVLSPQL